MMAAATMPLPGGTIMKIFPAVAMILLACAAVWVEAGDREASPAARIAFYVQ
jgi:hypothetical protein